MNVTTEMAGLILTVLIAILTLTARLVWMLSALSTEMTELIKRQDKTDARLDALEDARHFAAERFGQPHHPGARR